MIKVIIGLVILAALVVGVILIYRNNNKGIDKVISTAEADAIKAQAEVNKIVDKAKDVAADIKK
jgi:preprotein translocase subunit SecG